MADDNISKDKAEELINAVSREVKKMEMIRDNVDTKNDPVNHPSHYTNHSSGIEVIEITAQEDFLTGNAIKYLMRHRDKGKPVEDLKKAIWYITKRIELYELGKLLEG